MARVAEANTSTYIQGSVDYYAYTSGTNIIVDVYFQMRRTNTYSGDTYGATAVPNICISGDPNNFGYVGSSGIRVVGGQQNVWQTIFTASRTFDSSRSGQTIYVGWKVTNDNSGYLGGSAVAAITLPSAATPPTGLTCANIVAGEDSFTATVSVTGWGTGTGAKYRELQCWSSWMTNPRRYQPVMGSELTGSITVSNSSGGELTITPNTEYAIGAYASNGEAFTQSPLIGNYSTLPPTSTLTNTAVTETTANFSVNVPNQGGKYDMVLKYQLDSAAPVTVTTFTGSGTKSGSFTISGLSSATTYTVVASLTTSVGEVVSNTVTFTTAQPPVKLYGSVSGQTKLVKKIYGSVNSQTKKIKKIYGSVNGETKLIYRESS